MTFYSILRLRMRVQGSKSWLMWSMLTIVIDVLCGQIRIFESSSTCMSTTVHTLVTEHCTRSEHGSVSGGTQPSSSRARAMLWFHVTHDIIEPNCSVE